MLLSAWLGSSSDFEENDSLFLGKCSGKCIFVLYIFSRGLQNNRQFLPHPLGCEVMEFQSRSACPQMRDESIGRIGSVSLAYNMAPIGGKPGRPASTSVDTWSLHDP